MVERLLCMREVPVFFSLFLGTSLQSVDYESHL